jgi:hypothetical protein
MLDTIRSKNSVDIRLTSERWVHITEQHCEMAGWKNEVMETIAFPVRILSGNDGECLAIQEVEKGKWLVVVYREQGGDGFVITAFLTRRIRSLDRRKQLWP